MTDLDHDVTMGQDDGPDDIDLSTALTGISGSKRKSIRSEPSTQISEFSLHNQSDKVRLHELVGTLSASTTAAGELKKQLRNVHKHQKVLSTPLSRFEQGAISRSVAYEQTSEEVSKWDPIVENNKKAEQLEFPLEKPAIKVHTGAELSRKIQPFTPLEKEIAILLHGSDNVLPEKSGLTKAEQRALQAMDIGEARRRRAELQKYRALLSYKESRAKRQKKIKSKQFHRILNKERRKTDAKVLNTLEEDDPEELKKRIERAEKSRIQERMSLKHHGGSKKMKQKMIYAKYDKDARLQVDDMLQTSKELRQKKAVESDSEEDLVAEPMVEEEEEGPKKFSPWVGSALSGLQNPWLKATKDVVKASPYSRPEAVVADRTEIVEDDDDEQETTPDVTESIVPFTSAETEVYVIGEPAISDDDEPPKVVKKAKKEKPKATTETVEENENDMEDRDEIDDIFDAAKKRKTKKNASKKKSKSQKGKKKDGTQNDQSKNKKKKQKSKKSGESERSDSPCQMDDEDDESGLTISTTRKRTLDDMHELAEQAPADAVETRRKPQKTRRVRAPRLDPSRNIYAEPTIDPSKFLTVPGKELTSSAAPLVAECAEGDDVRQVDLIAEAFADDDVMDTFSKEKTVIEEEDKPKAIDLTLPGWGSWGGTDIAVPKKKRKRFLVKPPQSEPRKDKNLKHVIINETKDKSIAKHQVSWLPRSYKNVHQFESNIRAPIGRQWNPETSHRDLTKPKVVTHLGTIIAPMDASQKFQKQQIEEGPKAVIPKRKKGRK